jgi:hypothetical protein
MSPHILHLEWIANNATTEQSSAVEKPTDLLEVKANFDKKPNT